MTLDPANLKWLPPLPLLSPMKPPSLNSVPQGRIPSLCLQHSPRRFCHPPVIPQLFLPRKGLSPPPASSSTSFSLIRYAARLTLILHKSPCITHISTAALDKGLPTVITKNHLCKFGNHDCQSICKAMSTSFRDTAWCIGTLLSSLPKDKTIWTLLLGTPPSPWLQFSPITPHAPSVLTTRVRSSFS